MQKTVLRTDIPNEILEMLLFEGEPQGRSRQEIEEKFATAAHIPYLRKHLGSKEFNVYQQVALAAYAGGHLVETPADVTRGTSRLRRQQPAHPCHQDRPPGESGA